MACLPVCINPSRCLNLLCVGGKRIMLNEIKETHSLCNSREVRPLPDAAAAASSSTSTTLASTLAAAAASVARGS